jgi:flagellar FliJ protein
MKPFSLQTVLDYRKRLEDIAQHRFTEAKKTRASIEKKLGDEINALTEFIKETEKLQTVGIGITELIRHEEKITAQKNNITAIKKHLKERSELVHKEQQNLIHRCKERRIMEQLKETQNKARQVFLNKKEAAMLDELATSRHEPDIF